MTEALKILLRHLYTHLTHQMWLRSKRTTASEARAHHPKYDFRMLLNCFFKTLPNSNFTVACSIFCFFFLSHHHIFFFYFFNAERHPCGCTFFCIHYLLEGRASSPWPSILFIKILYKWKFGWAKKFTTILCLVYACAVVEFPVIWKCML